MQILAPVQAAERINLMDALRGIAIPGIGSHVMSIQLPEVSNIISCCVPQIPCRVPVGTLN